MWEIRKGKSWLRPCGLSEGPCLKTLGAFRPHFESYCPPVLDDCPAWIREVRSRSKKNGVGLPDDHRDKSAQKLIQSGRRTCGFPPICLLLGSEAILLVVKAVSGSIVLAMVLAGIGFLAWRRKPQGERHVEGSKGLQIITPIAPQTLFSALTTLPFI